MQDVFEQMNKKGRLVIEIGDNGWDPDITDYGKVTYDLEELDTAEIPETDQDGSNL